MNARFLPVIAGVVALFHAPVLNAASIVQQGGSYGVTLFNSPTSASQTVTADGSTKTIGSTYVKEAFYDDGPNGQWVTFTFSSVSGNMLAANVNSGWRVDVTALPFLTSAYYDGFFAYWSADGAAFQNITPFGGLTTVKTNPINTATGPVYWITPPSGAAVNSLSLFTTVDPWSFLSSGGMNPNTADSFTMAAHLTLANPVQTGVPEPATFAVAGLALAALAVQRYRSR